MAFLTFSPIIILTHDPTTPIILGEKRASTSFNTSINLSLAPKIKSSSDIEVVTTFIPSSSSSLAARNPQPEGPCNTATSTSRSLKVYKAATIGLGLGVNIFILSLTTLY